MLYQDQGKAFAGRCGLQDEGLFVLQGSWNAHLDKEFRRFPLDLKVYAYPGAALVIDAEGFGMQYLYESEEIIGRSGEAAQRAEEQVEKQLAHSWDETVFDHR